MSAVLPLPAAKRPSNSFLARLWRDKPLGALGGLVLLLFLVVGVFAPWVAPYDYNEIAPLDRMQGPSWAHWFGTDNLGRDMLSRCIYGAQLSVIIGCSAAALATLISGLIGIVSGYFGGKVDLFGQRVIEIWNALPELYLLIIFASIFEPSLLLLLVLLSLFGWIGLSDYVRIHLQARRQIVARITMKELLTRVLEVMKREDLGITYLPNRPADVPRLWVNAQKFQQLTNFQASYNFAEGLAETVAYYQYLWDTKKLTDIKLQNWERA
jgi:peptide/nickel transport system permease protein